VGKSSIDDTLAASSKSFALMETGGLQFLRKDIEDIDHHKLVSTLWDGFFGSDWRSQSP
jgi:hypothetical protein